MRNYIVKEESLTAIADSIRAKTGETEELVFPDGFVEAVDNLLIESDRLNEIIIPANAFTYHGYYENTTGDDVALYSYVYQPTSDEHIYEPGLLPLTITHHNNDERFALEFNLRTPSIEVSSNRAKSYIAYEALLSDSPYLKIIVVNRQCEAIAMPSRYTPTDERGFTVLVVLDTNCSLDDIIVRHMEPGYLLSLDDGKAFQLAMVHRYGQDKTCAGLFMNAKHLVSLPPIETGWASDMYMMFHNCPALTTVSLFDTSNVTNMYCMFEECDALSTIPLFDTRKVQSTSGMFHSCTSLTVVPALDLRNGFNFSTMFQNCYSLTECWLRNIKTTLQVGSGTSWGHLLTVESLLHLIKECRDTGYTKTLTIGTANMAKLANTYVRTIDITDEMRAEDDLIDEKLPFEVCESTDEGAMLISEYVLLKNWQLK